MDDRKKQLIMELITTALVILFYWLSTVPEWKLEMWGKMVKAKLRQSRHVRPGLSLEHREILRKFRQEISEWEHKNASEGN